jgi:hypothetical protein
VTATDIARPRFARMYLRGAASAEQRGATDHRRRLLQGVSGTFVEIGAGHGLPEAAAAAGNRSRRTLAQDRGRLPPCPRHHRGDHASRLDIEEIERYGFSAQRFEPLIPHILGTARRI